MKKMPFEETHRYLTKEEFTLAMKWFVEWFGNDRKKNKK